MTLKKHVYALLLFTAELIRTDYDEMTTSEARH